MGISVDKDVRAELVKILWQKADELNWASLSDLERASWYENWSKDKDIAGVLANYMDTRRIRVYIKDSLLKPYLAARKQGEWTKVALALGLNLEESKYKEKYIKPHGVQLLDGRFISWGSSRDWKAVVMSVYERSFKTNAARAYGAVLLETGKTIDEGVREMISTAAVQLGIEHTVWID